MRFHELMEQLKLKLRGYYTHYGLKDNSLGLKQFYTEAIKQLFKCLNRRSQRTSFNWAEFKCSAQAVQDSIATDYRVSSDEVGGF